MVQQSQQSLDDDVRVARTKQDVGHAALQILTQEGWESLSHAHVAATAKYSRTTLYTHWPSKIDLVTLALDAVGEMPHGEPSGDVRADIAGELFAFRQGILDFALDKVLMALAQWGATVDEIAAIRDRIVKDGESVLRSILADLAEGDELEAAVSMLSGVVVCPVIMYGEVPSDVMIEHAITIILKAFDAVPADQGSS